MKKTQLYAISKSYSEKRKKLLNSYLSENNLVEEFNKSGYKTITGFLKSKGVNI